jgi:endonuclease YncB( thermonuclease family)
LFFLLCSLAQALQDLTVTNKKLTGFYTVDAPMDFASLDLFPCHIVRVVKGIIIIYQTGTMHSLIKILHVRIKGVDLSKTEKQATALIKKILLKSSKTLYLNPRWDVGRGQIVADVFVDDQSLAQWLINQGCAMAVVE